MAWENVSLSINASSWELLVKQNELDSCLIMYFDPNSITHETGDVVTLDIDGTVVWGGFIHNKGEFQENGLVKVEAWGYVCELLDSVVSIDKTDKSPEYILNEVFGGTDYSLSTPVPTGLTISKYEYKGKARNVIGEMMDYSGFSLRIDYATKTIYFETEGRLSSGYNLGNSGIGCRVKRWEIEDISRLINRVYVVGEGFDSNGDPMAYQGTAKDIASIGLFGEKAYTLKIDYLSSDSEASGVASKLLRTEPGGGGMVEVAWEDIDNTVLVNKRINLVDTVRQIDGSFVVLEQTVSSIGPSVLTLSWDRLEGFTQAMRESNEIGLERMRVMDSTKSGGTGDIDGDTDGKNLDIEGDTDDETIGIGGTTDDETIGIGGTTDDETVGISGNTGSKGLTVTGDTDDDQQSSTSEAGFNTYTSVTGKTWQTVVTYEPPTDFKSDWSILIFVIPCMIYVDSTTSDTIIWWRLKNVDDTTYYPNVFGHVTYHGLDENDEQCVITMFALITSDSWKGDDIAIQMRCNATNDDFIIDVSPQIITVPYHTHPGTGLNTDPTPHTHDSTGLGPSPEYHDHDSPGLIPSPTYHDHDSPGLIPSPEYHDHLALGLHEEPSPHTHPVTIIGGVEIEVDIPKMIRSTRGWLLD